MSWPNPSTCCEAHTDSLLPLRLTSPCPSACCPATSTSSSCLPHWPPSRLKRPRTLAEMYGRRDDDRWQLVEVIKGLEHEADEVTHAIVTRLDRSSSPRSIPRTSTSWPRGSMTSSTGSTARPALADLPRSKKSPRAPGCSARSSIAPRSRCWPLWRRWRRGRRRRCCWPAARSSGWRRRATRCTTSGSAASSRSEHEPLMVIKWKELYDTLEKTLDSAEDAANVLESITIKHG